MHAAPLTARVILLAGLALAMPVAAAAQSNPSADSIVNALKPGGGMQLGTRGIRPPGGGAATEAPAPAAPQATRAAPAAAGIRPVPHQAAPASQAEAPSINLTVEFASNSAVLTPAAMRTLGELGRALASPTLAAYRFRIEGHTDTVGSPETNKALSAKRAEAVVEFLSARYQIDRARLEPEGMGQDGLLVQTPPNTPEIRNRRVQIVNLGA